MKEKREVSYRSKLFCTSRTEDIFPDRITYRHENASVTALPSSARPVVNSSGKAVTEN